MPFFKLSVLLNFSFFSLNKLVNTIAEIVPMSVLASTKESNLLMLGLIFLVLAPTSQKKKHENIEILNKIWFETRVPFNK